MPRCVRIGFPHHDEYLASRIACARGKPLATIDHILVAFALNGTLYVGCIRRGHRGFGHQESRSDLPGQQRHQPGLFLFYGPVPLQRLHVARIRRGAIEDFTGPGHTPHDLAKGRVVQIGNASLPFVRVRQEEVPEASSLSKRLELLDQWDRLPGVAGTTQGLHLVVVASLIGVDVLVKKRSKAIDQIL
ncbi:hypothetical protein D9M69_547490 [compost metagenome]